MENLSCRSAKEMWTKLEEIYRNKEIPDEKRV